MSVLPDLPTNQISYISYWNAIDQGGVSSIAPEDVLTDSNINSYTLYDNGIHIDSYSMSTVDRNCEARVKSDGWVIAYFDRTANFTRENGNPVRGWWDLVNNWTINSPPDYTSHTLERVIQSLQSNFGNSASISYNPTDVSLYNYEYPDATMTTGMAALNGNTGGFSYTSSTTIEAAVAVGASKSSGGAYAKVSFEGTNVARDNYSPSYGSYDLLANNVIPTAGTEYQMNTAASYSGYWANGNVIILWSE